MVQPWRNTQTRKRKANPIWESESMGERIRHHNKEGARPRKGDSARRRMAKLVVWTRIVLMDIIGIH